MLEFTSVITEELGPGLEQPELVQQQFALESSAVAVTSCSLGARYKPHVP